MATAILYDMNKKKVGDIDLPDSVFNVPVKKSLLHFVVCAHLSNVRQGTAKAKTRAEIRGGGKKPYKQKGTGRARHGSIRSPIFVGGGSTFGPKPRDWHVDMPKKQRKAALKMALTQKNKDGNLFVLEKFASKDGKTNGMAKVFGSWNAKSGLIVSAGPDEKTVRSVRNIPHVKIVTGKDLSTFDVVKYDQVMLTKDAVNSIVERLNG